MSVNADLIFEKTPREMVVSLMDTVELWRGKGKTLAQIYTALQEREKLSLSFTSFKSHYYRLRKKGVETTSKEVLLDKKSLAELSGAENKLLKEDGVLNTETEQQNSNNEVPCKSRAEILREKIQNHQRRARADFNQ